MFEEELWEITLILNLIDLLSLLGMFIQLVIFNTTILLNYTFQSYPMQEAFISLSYHPENSYCFVMDSKSNANFTYKMKQLAGCFDNIYISDKVWDF